MTASWCWSLILLSSVAYGQKAVEFTVIAKVPPLSGTAVGYAKDDKSIFLRDWESYYHYSFQTNQWNKLKLGKKLNPLVMWSSKSLNFGYSKAINDFQRLDFSPITQQIPLSFLPSFAKILILSDQLEILDIETLEVSYIPIDGGLLFGAGTAVWQEKIYMFGILTPSETEQQFHKKGIELSSRLIAFDPSNLTFQELAPLPGPRLGQGAFVNENLYVLWGDSESRSSSDILRYDPQLNKWGRLGELQSNIAGSAMASSGELIFLLGTRDIVGYLGVYNTTTNQYAEYTTNVKWRQGLACVHDNKLYYFGGIDIDFPRWIARSMYVLDLATLAK